MNIELQKASGKAFCRGGCGTPSEFVNDKGRIIKGTTCAAVSVYGAGGSVTAYYCRSCLEKVYLTIKKNLDPKLWNMK
jgi:hypothetical protein